MKKSTIILFLLLITPWMFAQQPKKMTEKFFPDPDVEMDTPSFKKKDIASYEDVIQYIQDQISGKDYVSLQYIGESQKGKKIPAVLFKSTNSKLKILFTARIHGDEPGGTEAMLYLIHQLVTDPKLTELRENIDIAILPMVNIDGGEKQVRPSNNGLDLNRDMTKLEAPESVALRTFYNQFVPDACIDFHEYHPFRADYIKLGSFGVTGSADIMFLYCENANYPAPLGELFQNVYLPHYEKSLTDNKLTYCKYFTSAKVKGETVLNIGGGSPRSSSSAFGLPNAISMLVEVRGAGLGKTSLKRRAYTSYLIALNTLQVSLENASTLKNKINEAINSHQDIVVTEKRETVQRQIPFIDIDKNEMTEITMPTRDVADRKPSIVRNRPKAYAILPENKAVAEKLKQLGVSVETLPEEQIVNGESYTITDYKKGNEKFEGFYEQIVETQVKQKSITLPKGSFIVDMKQKNANVTAVVLEPEAENGFIRYNVLPVENGIELPIYRISNQ